MSDTSSPAETKPVSVPAEPDVAPEATASDEVATSRAIPDPTRYGDWEKNGRCIDF
jgi:hypothetical protein